MSTSTEVTVKHKTNDISGSPYLSVETEHFTGIFRQIDVDDGHAYLPSVHTLKDSPTGWVDRMEQELEERGYQII